MKLVGSRTDATAGLLLPKIPTR